MRTITPEQHWATTFTPSPEPPFYKKGKEIPWKRYAKPSETQKHAITRFEAARKRRVHAAPQRRFPVFIPDVTTVASYAQSFWAMNNLLITGKEVLSDAPQGLFDDSVLAETES